ncbi:ATP-binding protein [Hyalangium rubrum]|uniref:histidine kinase n=1 Tax=Hyalangium rubrum TaxID=3103134 RepID=A0ABU5GX70_9BACT|nr:ATP-binding protein [Hyalangium sp. s54d21]MDY7225472.1 ATP-binding protein [Hyalangium sp. s54d21]
MGYRPSPPTSPSSDTEAPKNELVGGQNQTGKQQDPQLEASVRLLRALTEAQLEFIQGSNARKLFDRLLEVLLDLTSSEYGFIGEVLYTDMGVPYLKTYAITNIAWTDELREQYHRLAPQGMEFRNLKTLFGTVLTTGEHVISNTPDEDTRAGGRPHGHPPLKAFLGLPFKSGKEMVGMVGIANRPEGYDTSVIEFLQPFLATCCSVILGWRSEQQRRHAEEMLLHREEELRRHRDHLEELVHIRTEKLLKATQELEKQQAQLILSEKLASVGQLAAGIAHEINNPLGYVMSNLSTLTQYVATFTRLLGLYRAFGTEVGPTLPPHQAEALGRICALWEQEGVGEIESDVKELLNDCQEGTQRVKDIIQSLKSFIREEAGEPRLVDVNKELMGTLKMMMWSDLKHRCEVRTEYGEIPAIVGYPTQISQVFTNLLSNAAQAIEDRGEIRISTQQEGNMVVVRITDSGVGMTPEVLAKLFTPFYTTKPPGKGTGLGLSISYGIISRHQGRIEVQSKLGSGTTFTLKLPVAPELAGTPASRGTPTAATGS